MASSTPYTIPDSPSITSHQHRVYSLLLQVPAGRVTTYAALAKALKSAPRAVGGALRSNPFAPDVPCHRCIASTGYVGGFMGDWQAAPSGQNQTKKLSLLEAEGVWFNGRGMLINKRQLFDEFSTD